MFSIDFLKKRTNSDIIGHIRTITDIAPSVGAIFAW